MDEAKAIINIKEGIIEISGPVVFVRTYLDRYQGKGIQTPKSKTPKIKTKPSRVKEPEPSIATAQTKKITCIGSIYGFINSGFFKESRLFVDIRKHFAESGIIYPDKTIRTSLSRLVKTGILNVTGKRRRLRYGCL